MSVRTESVQKSDQKDLIISDSDVTDPDTDFSDDMTDAETDMFQCPDCGRTFKSENSLKAHMLRVHHKPVKWSRGGPPSPQEDDLTQDFKAEAKLTKAALDLARNKQRLKQTDPQLYRVLHGSADSDPTRSLVNLEIVRFLKALREEEEAKVLQHNNNNNNNQVLLAYQKQIEALQKEIATLKQELNQKTIEALKNELTGEIKALKEKVASGQSDFAAALNTVSKHVAKAADRIETIAMAFAGFVPADTLPQNPAPEEARTHVLDELRKHNLVVKVRDKR